MSFKCDKCCKNFKLKHHLDNHLNKKNVCNKINNDNNTTYKCLLCNKEYNYLTSLTRHKKTHINYNEEIDKLEEQNEIKKLKELFITQNEKLCSVIDEQKKEIQSLKENIVRLLNNNITNNTTTNNNTTNNNTTNNNTINNTTNIIIAFGSEEYESLSKSEIKKILFDNNVDPLLGMIEYIHFNERLPQQQNIKYNNLRSKVIDIYNGTKWIVKDLDIVLDDLLENNIYNLDKIREMITEEYKPKIKQIVKTIIDDYYNHYKLDTEDKQDKKNKKLIEKNTKTKNDVKLCVYLNTKNKKK